ncbi:methionyl-tRNA formyltransferase [Gemella sp. zg-1178]|uniref:methionyl-tRNA formyltransferase n=1 Tax=Gemella sp. zg-1178 TaxID=2840372 RepID=UPI001C04A623|nr:methionyl-tRNA formyltransferase [Gemella sp. zg-1178]MBU0278510.1 methionyl-tRNA formyltransferase [Gemella sp. zg-1178]
MKNKKIVFMGTPNFSVPILKMLINDFGVNLVITQPDKKIGRKKILTPSPVKVLAEEHNIKVLQPINISHDEEVFNELKLLNPDIIITAAYGQLIPEKILNLPEYKCVNVHGSLLPELRGGAPIQYSILKDFKETGVTIMYMEKSLDSGDMISKASFPILDSDNYQSVHDKMSLLGRDLLKETLPNIFSKNINPVKQDHSQATFAPNISRKDEQINWNENARTIFNKIRAFDPAPGAFTYLDKDIFKIWKAQEVFDIENNDKSVGTIIKQENNALFIKCGDNTVLKLLEVQMSGKKRVDIKSFLSNKKDYLGIRLGDLNE